MGRADEAAMQERRRRQTLHIQHISKPFIRCSLFMMIVLHVGMRLSLRSRELEPHEPLRAEILWTWRGVAQHALVHGLRLGHTVLCPADTHHAHLHLHLHHR